MKTINKIKYSLFLIIVLFLCGCNSMFNPDLDNVFGEQRASTNPQTALGFLNSAYTSIPSTYSFSECATDDAVMNDPTSSFPRMVGGSWNALFDPLANWSPTYWAIMNVNQFMTYLPKITISWSSETNDSLYRKRWTGEAYGMRGFLHLQLLQYYGGKDNSGAVLGVPYLSSVIGISESNWVNLKRPLFVETVAKIASDLDSAIVYLPMDYSGTTSIITGLKNRGRFTKRIAYASKARLYMHAASPLFNGGDYNKAYCDSAVKYSVLAIGANAIGTNITSQLFYTTDSPSTSEIIWRMNMITEATTDAAMAATVEARNYPPSKSGKGQVNPTQEFVDAFPDKNGYPITESTIYSASSPYLNRDGRLDSMVIRDGGKLKGIVIHTAKSDSKDGIENPGATRTGYYLKKLLRPDVSITNPVAGKKNMYPIFRTTEMYLIFAEAQTASKGADVTYQIGTSAKSPRTVIKGIRTRSGIPSADVYATNLAASDFMKLIRNERRIELAFEGFRFTDLRRWMLPLNGTVHRARILTAGGSPQILEITEEPRNYSQFMYFAPIPNNEILKCPNIVQNAAQ
ncbi:MAG: RagB/SusD family nutrient uptake outer membrane protein [Bacteroidota bacterium]|nr:RagB/SusD family nutrient uptake outer membrane protein [Bacteroidota bacterium]